MILWIWGRISPRRFQPVKREEPFKVSVVMAVYNEEGIIAEKMKNLLAMDYPQDKVEILIGSDGSTDRTDEIIKSFNDQRVRLIHYDVQSGKVAVQNRLLKLATGDLVLFTDADALLTPGSLKIMAERFLDPKVAVVHPSFRRINKDGSPAESFYDRWENKVKDWEARIGALVGCYGYANLIRKEFAQPIPDGIILDDFYFGIRPFRQGMDVTSEPRALVVTQAESEEIEFRRKVRISSGNLQALLHFYDLLSPKYGKKAWVYFSHKVLRMLIPFILLSILIVSAVKFNHPFFRVLFIVQLFGYATIPLAIYTKGLLRRLLVVQYYLLMNMALVVGYWRYFFARERFWRKTPRRIN